MVTRGGDLSNKSGIWITWEKHQRTRELAKFFGVPLYELLFTGSYPLKVLVLGFKTLRLIVLKRPKILIVQNPSIVLASLACFLRIFFRYFLVVDRHSNFKLDKLDSPEFKYRGFHWLSKYSLRNADLTIVTNKELIKILEEMGGTGFVMPDKFPALPFAHPTTLSDGHHVLYICSYDDDEPVSEVMEAARLLGENVTIHVTGNNNKAADGIIESAPRNIDFTGFLSEEDYQSLLASVDVVLTLTTMPHTMQCGAYEAVAASRPIVFGPDKAMVEYFHKGRVVTEIDSDSIAVAIQKALENFEQLHKESQVLKRERDLWWNENLKNFFQQLP